MDNSNANNGGFSPIFPGGQNPQNGQSFQNPQPMQNPQMSATPEQQNSGAQNEVIIRPSAPKSKLVNARTQSLIESPRDKYKEDMAKAAAYEAQMRDEQRKQQLKNNAKKSGVYAALGIFGLVFLAALIFMLVAIANNSSSRIPDKPQEGPGEVEPGASVINGYNCKSKDCRLMNELPDGRMLIRDSGGFYLFDSTSEEAPILTSIENKEFSSITSFNWGSRILAVLAPTTEPKALFSITENRLLTQYEYDKFYTDFTDKTVYDSTAVTEELYIIAKKDTPKQYSLIDLHTGFDVVRGSNGIYTDGIFYFGYEGGNTVRVFSEGIADPFVSSNNATFFTRNGVLIMLTPNNSGAYAVSYYDKDGKRLNTSKVPFYDELKKLKKEELIDALRSNNKFLEIPKK